MSTGPAAPQPRPRRLRGLILLLSLLALAGLSIVALSEARRNAARHRIAAADAAARRADLDRAAERIRDLEIELAAALTRSQALAQAIDAQREAARVAGPPRDARQQGFTPMPEGVRIALRALEARLDADGFAGLRFLRAERLEEHALHAVELVDVAREDGSVRYYRVATLTCALDRAASALTIGLHDGVVVRDGLADRIEHVELRFAPVTGPDWESTLPYLVVASGAYPAPDAADGGASLERLDPLTRARWAERIASLLDRAGTTLHYRIGRFRGLRDGRLIDVALHGYDERKLLAQSAEARAAAIEVDHRLGTVSLLLEDGVLRGPGGESTIPAQGYRILLPDVTPEQALDAMLGFVVLR